jgi:hypothetical protein
LFSVAAKVIVLAAGGTIHAQPAAIAANDE